MGIFDFLAPKNPFVIFSGKIERLRALLNVMEQEVQREYFMQLKGHIKSVQNLVGSKDALNSICIIRLLLEEKRKINELSSSEDKTEIQNLENEIEKSLIAVVQTLRDAILLCDAAIASRQNPQELQKYKQEIEKRVIFLEKIIEEIKRRASVVNERYDRCKVVKQIQETLPESIPFSGRMSNGITGYNIQKVIRQLGGYMVASDGRHPYKIVFPGKGQIGFSFTMSPSAFLKEVSHLTGIDQKTLEVSFRQGELVR